MAANPASRTGAAKTARTAREEVSKRGRKARLDVLCVDWVIHKYSDFFFPLHRSQTMFDSGKRNDMTRAVSMIHDTSEDPSSDIVHCQHTPLDLPHTSISQPVPRVLSFLFRSIQSALCPRSAFCAVELMSLSSFKPPPLCLPTAVPVRQPRHASASS